MIDLLNTENKIFEGILLVDGIMVASCTGNYNFVSKDIMHYYSQYLQDKPKTIKVEIKEI